MTRPGRSAGVRCDRRGAEEPGDATSDAARTTSDPGRPSPSSRVTGRLVALSASAVLAVYAAGYIRTRPAAERIAGAAADRRSLERAPPPIGLAIPPVQTIPARPTTGVTAGDSRGVHARSPKSPVQPPDPASQHGQIRPREPRDGRHHPRAGTNDSQPDPPTVPVQAPKLATGEPSFVSGAPPQSEATNRPPSPAAPLATNGYKDGTYFGWGTSRHGDIQASVVIVGGRIASASIAQCLTRYPCSWIASLPGEVVARQSPKIDYVSGATQSTEAFSSAVIDALSKAK